MKSIKTQNQSNITREQLLKVVDSMVGTIRGRPTPNEPDQSGPWDPFVREAFDRMIFFGPFPEPWHDRFDAERVLRILARRFPQIWDEIGDGRSFDEAALNPQPLPPRWSFAEALAQVLIRRAELVRDVINSLRATGFEERGIIVVGGRDFLTTVDEMCGNGFRLVRPKPRPFWWKDSFEATEYFVMAARFERSANETADEILGGVFRESAAKLLDAGLARLH